MEQVGAQCSLVKSQRLLKSCSAHHPDSVVPALEETLQELQLHYLDVCLPPCLGCAKHAEYSLMLGCFHQLYLIHWPVAFEKGSNLFPLIPGKNEPIGEVVLAEDVSLVDTWKGTIGLAP